jgi:hypothetical protein
MLAEKRKVLPVFITHKQHACREAHAAQGAAGVHHD